MVFNLIYSYSPGLIDIETNSLTTKKSIQVSDLNNT